MGAVKAKQLLVEGQDDLFTIVGLMEHHVPWPNEAHLRPVHIVNCNGVDEMLVEGFISTKLKESGLKTLGIVLDANGEPAGSRWQRVRSLCSPMFPDMPAQLPADGAITRNDDGQRLGVWIMPDNRSSGMLETFLKFLIPEPAQPVWAHAQRAFAEALKLGAPCREPHIDKAHLHTWLAWQNPPGERLGIALTKKILNPKAVTALPFIGWFQRLYDLEPVALPNA